MTKKKWHACYGKEVAAYAHHFYCPVCNASGYVFSSTLSGKTSVWGGCKHPIEHKYNKKLETYEVKFDV